jgi:hypothetical protein
MVSFPSGDCPGTLSRPRRGTCLGGKGATKVLPACLSSDILRLNVLLPVTLSGRDSIGSYRHVASETLAQNEIKYSSIVQPKQC